MDFNHLSMLLRYEITQHIIKTLTHHKHYFWGPSWYFANSLLKVFDQFDTDNSGSLSKEEIKYACNCLGLKAWDIDEFFVGLDENGDGEISLQEFKDNLPPYVFKAMAGKLTKDGLIEGL